MKQNLHQETLSRLPSEFTIHHKTIEEFGFFSILSYAVGSVWINENISFQSSSVCHCDPFHLLHSALSSYFFAIKLN
jgi:hypothetical protein